MNQDDTDFAENPRPKSRILLYFLLTSRHRAAFQYMTEEFITMLELRGAVVELRRKIADIMVRL